MNQALGDHDKKHSGQCPPVPSLRFGSQPVKKDRLLTDRLVTKQDLRQDCLEAPAHLPGLHHQDCCRGRQ